jgi:hypothetical protein
MNTTRPLCETCGCRLAMDSIKEGNTKCYSCGGGHYATHLDAIDASDAKPTRRPVIAGATCQKGHDWETHGLYTNTGGGRMSRKCRACNSNRRKQLRARARAEREQAVVDSTKHFDVVEAVIS